MLYMRQTTQIMKLYHNGSEYKIIQHNFTENNPLYLYRTFWIQVDGSWRKTTKLLAKYSDVANCLYHLLRDPEIGPGLHF